MKVYDAFLFNDELELLKLRLQLLGDVVEQFIIVESKRTLAGEKKPLHFLDNQNLFQQYLHKIKHVEVAVNDLSSWEYEFFQRNAIKEGLQQCNDDDIIFISDADEIINIPEVLKFQNKFPALVELPMYYYYANLKTNVTFFVNLVGRWSFIKHLDLGFRYRDYQKYTSSIIGCRDVTTGWHFSYLFGTNVEKYQQKIRSFSHQEYNTPYFLNSNRIEKCVRFGIDLFERPFMKLNMDNASINPLRPYLYQLSFDVYYKKPQVVEYFHLSNIFFLLRKSWYGKLKYYFRNKRAE